MTEAENEYVKKILAQTNALITEDEAKFLYSLPKYISSEGVIVEIGSYKGGSTILLAKGSLKYKKGEVYAIDHWKKSIQREYLEKGNKDPVYYFFKNIKRAGVSNYIHPIKKTSKDAFRNWNKPISLLWIDGNHSYSFVKLDFLLWEKYLIEGGLIAFHDTENAKNLLSSRNYRILKNNGPATIVEKDLKNSGRFCIMGKVDSITYAKKIKKAKLSELIRIKFTIKLLYLTSYLLRVKDLYLLCDRKFGLFGKWLAEKNFQLYFVFLQTKPKKQRLVQIAALDSKSTKQMLIKLYELCMKIKTTKKRIRLVTIGDSGSTSLLAMYFANNENVELFCLANKKSQYGLNSKLRKLVISKISHRRVKYLKESNLENTFNDDIEILYIDANSCKNFIKVLDCLYPEIRIGSYVVIDNYFISGSVSYLDVWINRTYPKIMLIPHEREGVYFQK